MPVDGEPVPLHRVLLPGPIPIQSGSAVAAKPMVLRLVRDDRPRPATAIVCHLADLARWAESVPTAQLTAMRGAVRGDRALVVGQTLPPLARGERFWGRWVLIPLGFHIEPDLPDSALREAMGLDADDLALVREDGIEVVSTSVLEPLTRAGIRLAQPKG